MPRIQASSVAENRDLRRTALLQAARDLLRDGGESAVTMSAAACTAGLSRPAAYEYFDSSAALRQALVDAQAEYWTSVVASALDRAADTDAKIRVFVETSVQLLSTDATPSGLSDTQVSHFHEGPGRVLARSLSDDDTRNSDLVARLVGGAIVAVLRSPESAHDVVSTVTAFLNAGMTGLSATRSQR
ncbi:MAG: TetR/AcrR family transcriptional regulator [Actinomycetota bacterium]